MFFQHVLVNISFFFDVSTRKAPVSPATTRDVVAPTCFLYHDGAAWTFFHHASGIRFAIFTHKVVYDDVLVLETCSFNARFEFIAT